MMVKVCGITRAVDAVHAVRCGATAVGFVFWRASPRYVPPERAGAIAAELPPGIAKVGVFVNETGDDMARIAAVAGLTTIQLHGDEPPESAAALTWPVWRAISLPTAADALGGWPVETTFLLDAHDPATRGGTGRIVDWRAAAAVAAKRRVVLAGGLTPENVEEAIAVVRPFGVDVSSGVEEAPGVKDFDKVARFLERARVGSNGR